MLVRVLTIDDDTSFLNAAHDLIDATPGFEPCAELTSGEAGLVAVERDAPDLILVDVNMPDMNGIEFARLVRVMQHPAVVILITARELDQLPSTVRECGAAAVVGKQDLLPGRLQELWRVHKDRGRPA